MKARHGTAHGTAHSDRSEAIPFAMGTDMALAPPPLHLCLRPSSLLHLCLCGGALEPFLGVGHLRRRGHGALVGQMFGIPGARVKQRPRAQR